MLSNRQLEHKGTIKASEINHLLPHFKLLKSEMANLVNLVSLANCEQKIDTRIFHLQQYLVSTAVFQFLNTLVSCWTCLKLSPQRKVRSFFLLRRNTRRFNNKLIHEDVCFAFNENNYILQATIELFSR